MQRSTKCVVRCREGELGVVMVAIDAMRCPAHLLARPAPRPRTGGGWKCNKLEQAVQDPKIRVLEDGRRLFSLDNNPLLALVDLLGEPLARRRCATVSRASQAP